MADRQKLARKHQCEVLEPGEELIATLLAAPDGAIKAAAIAGGVGGVLGTGGTSAGMRAGGEKLAGRRQPFKTGRRLPERFRSPSFCSRSRTDGS